MRGAIAAAAALLLSACAVTPAPPPSPQTAFFNRLAAHCGKAYAGRLVTRDAADADMVGKAMVMHVRSCSPTRIEIPFHIADAGQGVGANEGPDAGQGVGAHEGTGGEAWDRSRTWIITRTAAGLRLKHDHRHADGSPDALTLYGGDTADMGSAARQDFPVDAPSIAMFTASNRAASTTNVWTIEVTPDRFAYQLRRAGRHFRVEFDLATPQTVPPPPWGW